MAELTRHRVGVAFSIRSTRYVDEGENPIVHHPLLDQLFDADDELYARFVGVTNESRRLYRDMAAAIERDLADQGVDTTTARKQARGAARGILPSALETTIVWTANVHRLDR
jgi:thymidylate synthase (FAD)